MDGFSNFRNSEPGSATFQTLKLTKTKIDPSALKITDIRFADIDGANKRCSLLKIYTSQGLVGYGELRDASSRTYAAMLKSRILGENPCNVERIFGGSNSSAGELPSGGRCLRHRSRPFGDVGGKRGVFPFGNSSAASSVTKFASIVMDDSQGGGRDGGGGGGKKKKKKKKKRYGA